MPRILAGLVGYNISNGNSLTNVYSTGTVTAGLNSVGIGGLFGTSIALGPIQNSYSSSSVTVGSGSSAVGGLGGHNETSVTTSYSSGAIDATGSTNVGGFIGNNLGTVTNSYWIKKLPPLVPRVLAVAIYQAPLV